MQRPQKTHVELREHGNHRADDVNSIEAEPILRRGSMAALQPYQGPSAPRLFDPAGTSHDITEAPIKWRLHWRLSGRFVTEYSHKPQYKDFQTSGEAKSQKRATRAQFGDEVVVCIEPIFLSRRTREKRRCSGQLSVADGWPLQRRDPIQLARCRAEVKSTNSG